MKPDDFCPTAKAEMHHFSDASDVGYGTASYLLLINEDGRRSCGLLMAKSRVAPLKKITVPRMELTAAVIAVKVDKLLRQELETPLGESVFWTDSLTVLRYIENDALRFKTFVANRVTFIREATSPSQWRYVNSSLNPADIASRGTKFTTLIQNHNWICGPHFLYEEESEWPTRPDIPNTMDKDSEIKKAALVSLLTMTEVSPIKKLVEYYSDWHKLKKAVAWMLRMKDLLHYLVEKRKECKEVAVLKESESLKQSQKVHEKLIRLRSQ
uniref:PPUP8834 n=1 Tax=Poeciliopsis prolifica TaxID=188132 RepID=A0A0S7ENZ8_9TELE